MFKNSKFLIVTVFLEVMFFCVSSSAMKNNNHEKKLENIKENKKESVNSLNNEIKESDNKKENNSENEDIAENVIKNKDKENDVENKKIKENVNESKILKSGTKEHNNNNNSIGIEYKNFIDYWMEIWEEFLNSLAEQNKLTNLEQAKEYIEKLIKKDIENFEDVLERFEKYGCEFKEYEKNEYSEYDFFYEMKYYDEFFDFEKLEEILKKENEDLLREKNMQIDEELVINYVKDFLRDDESLRNKTKTYKDLIRDAYIDYLNKNSYDYIVEPSRTIKYDESQFIFNKEDSIGNLDEENKKKKLIIRMKEILEKIKESNDEDIFYASCSELYLAVNHKENREQYVKPILKKFDGLEDIFEEIIKDEEKYFVEYIFRNIFNREDNKKNKYFERLIRVLKQAASEGISKGFIDGILKSLEGEGSTREIIEKFKKCLDEKFKMMNRVSSIETLAKDILTRPTQENKQELFKLLRDGLSDNIFKKIEGFLTKDIDDIKMVSENRRTKDIVFEKITYIKTIVDLSYEYKFTFFDKLKGLIESDFKDATKIKKIKLILNDIEKNNLSEDKLKELIDELKGNIGDENIEKLRHIGGKEFFKLFIKKIESLIEENSINFYVNLKETVEEKYKEVLCMEKIIGDLNNILTVLESKTNKEEIKSRLDEFIKNIKNFSESEKVIPKIKSLFKKLTLQEFLQFINNVKEDVEKQEDISDVYDKIVLLTNDRYEVLQVK